MTMTEDTTSTARTAGSPAGEKPFLYQHDRDIPDGWDVAEAIPGGDDMLAYDPRRHTVVRNIAGAEPDQPTMDALTAAGFEQSGNFQFFVRDRSAPANTAGAEQGASQQQSSAKSFANALGR